MKRKRPKSKGWLRTHCQVCGHHKDCHGDYGECDECWDSDGPCKGEDTD